MSEPISILLPYIEKDELYKNCVASLKANTKDYELIELTNPEKKGFVKNVNEGLTKTKNDVIIIHTDMLFTKDWLIKLLDYVNKNQDVGIFGCKLIYPDGRIQSAGGQILGLFNIGDGSLDMGQYDQTNIVPFVTFAGNYIRREVINKIGLLDENYSPACFDDVDYCFRAKKSGFKIMYVPVELIHLGSQTMKQNPKLQEIFKKNWGYFQAKYMDVLAGAK